MYYIILRDIKKLLHIFNLDTEYFDDSDCKKLVKKFAFFKDFTKYENLGESKVLLRP